MWYYPCLPLSAKIEESWTSFIEFLELQQLNHLHDHPFQAIMRWKKRNTKSESLVSTAWHRWAGSAEEFYDMHSWINQYSVLVTHTLESWFFLLEDYQRFQLPSHRQWLLYEHQHIRRKEVLLPNGALQQKRCIFSQLVCNVIAKRFISHGSSCC